MGQSKRVNSRFTIFLIAILIFSFGISGSILSLSQNSENLTFMPGSIISEFSRGFIEFASATITASSDSDTTPEDTPIDFLYGNIVTGSDTDSEGEELTIDSVTDPPNGTAEIFFGEAGTADDKITYTPDQDFVGTDTFRYEVMHGSVHTGSATITVTVTAVNDPPTADSQTGGNAVSATEDTDINIVLTGSDVEGDALAFIPTDDDENGIPDGLDGTLSANVELDNDTNVTVTYTPTLNFNGETSFTFITQDQDSEQPLSSTLATVTINVAEPV